MTLFDGWFEKARQDHEAMKELERKSRAKGQKCSNCLHHRGHEFSPKYHYCKLRTSKHTPNGLAKTNASGWCAKWEAKP